MDEGIAHKALTHFHALQNPVNVEQVNAAVGMNVFLLDAILIEADKKLAADNGALFSKESFQGLKHLRSLPPQASQQPYLNTVQITTNTDNNWNKLNEIGLIESSEGTIVPVDLYDDDVDDETVFGNNSIGE